MTSGELLRLLELVQRLKTETQILEIKAEEVSYPTGLYDTLYNFSNQDEGGIILFGVNEKDNFNEDCVMNKCCFLLHTYMQIYRIY